MFPVLGERLDQPLQDLDGTAIGGECFLGSLTIGQHCPQVLVARRLTVQANDAGLSGGRQPGVELDGAPQVGFGFVVAAQVTLDRALHLPGVAQRRGHVRVLGTAGMFRFQQVDRLSCSIMSFLLAAKALLDPRHVAVALGHLEDQVAVGFTARPQLLVEQERILHEGAGQLLHVGRELQLFVGQPAQEVGDRVDG
ncbi:MAG: hypothetical protein ACYS5W_25010, partial [Planctomycetota bacterium]